MVKAQTTREQAEIAKQNGDALFAFACKCGGEFGCDGPLSHEIARPLIRLMGLVVADRVDAKALTKFVNREESKFLHELRQERKNAAPE
jgi:hypothetical protein